MKESVKLAIVVAAVVGAAFAFTTLQKGKGYGLKTGAPAPTFTLPDLGGRPVDLGALRGKWVLVNFWASWCPPCISEMPSLERLHRALSPAGLVVLGVSVDDDEAAMRKVLQDVGVSFTVLRDRGSRAAGAYRTTGFPETFLVNPDGVLVEKYVGPVEWDQAGAIEHFRALLKH